MDPGAEFFFVGDSAEAPEESEPFDVAGVRISHHGDTCSFETFLVEYGLEDHVLTEIAEIVHDTDLMDEKYGHPESEGLESMARGMQLALPDDEALIRHNDALYAYLRREVL